MNQLTEKERQFALSISESIGELVKANSGILLALQDLKDDKVVSAIVPFTQQIGAILLKMLTETRHYSEVELTSVS